MLKYLLKSQKIKKTKRDKLIATCSYVTEDSSSQNVNHEKCNSKLDNIIFRTVMCNVT